MPKNLKKSQKARTNRSHGLWYKNYNNKIVKKKSPANIDCGCSLTCSANVNASDQKYAFDEYYKLNSSLEKQLYIRGLVDRKEVNCHRFSTGKKNHDVRYSYNLKFQNRSVEVCLKFFCSTFQLSTATLYKWLKKNSNDELPHKLIGKASNHAVDKQHVIDFLNSLPKFDSHYCRRKCSNKKYLDPGITIAKLFDAYKLKCQEENLVSVSRALFYEIFKNDTNISIKRPQKDTCSRCTEWQMKINSCTNGKKKKRLKDKKIAHLEEVEFTRNELKVEKLKASEKYAVITVDLQKALPFPRLNVGPAYYSRNLYIYNFGIHRFPDNFNAHFYCWDETNGSRGSQELSSCVVDYLKAFAIDAESLVIFCDRCGGQNRNIKFVLMLLHYLSDPDVKLKSIDIKFMVSGHSYLPNDSDFGIIEKSCDEKEQIFMPQEYYDIIRGCQKKKMFIVHEKNYLDFKSTKPLEDSITRRTVDTNKEKINWLKISHIQLKKSDPFKIFFKEKLNNTTFRVMDLKKRRSQISNLNEVFIPNLYDGRLPITEAKCNDIKKLLKYMPKEKAILFEQISKELIVEDMNDSTTEDDYETDTSDD